SRDELALETARRLGNYYSDQYPEIETTMYECYSSALEGLVLLARLTGEERHLQTARRVADASMVFQHIWYSTSLGSNRRRSPCGGQVHCQLLTARGLLDLYEYTGEQRYLKPVLALHDFIQKEILSVAGGVAFYFNR